MMTDAISLVAHRGYQRKFPENTLLAYQEAIKIGARYIETDVQLSADGVPFLYHDEELIRISAASGLFHEYSANALREFSASEPARFGDQFKNNPITALAELCELIAAHREVTAFIEIKNSTIDFHGTQLVYQRVCEQLHRIEPQCYIISFSVPFISYCRQRGWPKVGVVLENWAQKEDPEIKAIKPDCMFCGVENLPGSGSIKISNTLLVIYEIDQPAMAKQLIKRGANMIETFDVGGMLKAI